MTHYTPQSTPIPIVFCITDLEVGGAERSLVDLVTRLAPERFVPLVISLAPRPQNADDALVCELESAGVPVEFLNARSQLQAPTVIRRLKRLLLNHGAELLQSFLLHSNVVGAIAGRLAGVPVIISGIRVSERRANLHHWLTRRTARWVTKHVCVSQSVADFTRRTVGLPAESLVVIPSCVDPNQYPASVPAQLTQLGIPAGRRGILFVGRLTRQKRVAWLLNRAPEIFARLPNHHFILVGQGKRQLHLQSQVRQLDIDDRVHFVGQRRDVSEIIAACDLLVLTSAWEGMPRVVLESMASGKPVVTTEVDGVVELLGSDCARQIVAQNDIQGFVDTVVDIAGDQQLAMSLGQQNRKRIVSKFHIERGVASYQRLYESLVQVRG